MGFHRIPCPGMYIPHKKQKPKKFVEYCQAYIRKQMPGYKAIGVDTNDEWTYILAMPDYESQKVIVKGKGKNKTRSYEQRWKKPVECYLSDDEIEYLKEKGMDKHGNK